MDTPELAKKFATLVASFGQVKDRHTEHDMTREKFLSDLSANIATYADNLLLHHERCDFGTDVDWHDTNDISFPRKVIIDGDRYAFKANAYDFKQNVYFDFSDIVMLPGFVKLAAMAKEANISIDLDSVNMVTAGQEQTHAAISWNFTGDFVDSPLLLRLPEDKAEKFLSAVEAARTGSAPSAPAAGKHQQPGR